MDHNVREGYGRHLAMTRAFRHMVADEYKGVKRPEDDEAFFEPTIPKRV